MRGWTTTGRPGYFGSRRDQIETDLDAEHGRGNWRLVWRVGSNVFSRQQMTMLYEDAYYEFLRRRDDLLDDLTTRAADVYDDSPSNINSGLDYEIQETGRTHVQDIAIRRVVSRLGRVFRGDELIQIRDSEGEDPLSLALSPGRVVFHRLEWIARPELEGWWQPGSVESFYQSNKLLQVRG